MGLFFDTRESVDFLPMPEENLQTADIIEAAKSNRCDLVTQMLNKDASSRFVVDDTGRTALHWATEYGYTRFAQILLNVPSSSENVVSGQSLLNIFDYRGQTALHIACNTRRQDLTSLYVTLHSDLNISDRCGNTPLHRAVRMNLETTAILMCEFGADVNSKNELMWTPLHEAVRTGNENIIRVLIQFGARLDEQTHNKMTPFLTAFFYYKIASKVNIYTNLENVWKLLIESGCSLSKSDGHWTPLTAAIACDNSFIASLLLLNGCRIDKGGRWGRGILQDAFACSEPALVKLLVLLGYIPSPEEVSYCCKQIPMYSKVFMRLPGLGSGLHKDRQEIVRWLKERDECPPTLSEFCRVSIRGAMNRASGDTSIITNIQKLPLPSRLKQFLAMADFSHYLMD